MTFAIVNWCLLIPGLLTAGYGTVILMSFALEGSGRTEIPAVLGAILPILIWFLGALLLRGYHRIWKGRSSPRAASWTWFSSALFNLALTAASSMLLMEVGAPAIVMFSWQLVAAATSLWGFATRPAADNRRKEKD